MIIENWNLTDVKPYEHNPRINDAAVDVVAASIQEFGFRQPIVIDKEGVIIVGHTRFKAAQKLGQCPQSRQRADSLVSGYGIRKIRPVTAPPSTAAACAFSGIGYNFFGAQSPGRYQPSAYFRLWIGSSVI